MLTVVAGLGRCGTSMVMQMLAAGGVRCVGQHPAYEVDEAAHAPLDYDWLRQCDGMAVKILDPHRRWTCYQPAQIIWLDRDAKQQARSQRKFLQAVTGLTPKVGALSAALRSDRKKCMRVIAPHHRLMISFEDVLRDPHGAAVRLTTVFPRLDVATAASVVRARSTTCAPDMSVEVSMMKMAN